MKILLLLFGLLLIYPSHTAGQPRYKKRQTPLETGPPPEASPPPLGPPPIVFNTERVVKAVCDCAALLYGFSRDFDEDWEYSEEFYHVHEACMHGNLLNIGYTILEVFFIMISAAITFMFGLFVGIFSGQFDLQGILGVLGGIGGGVLAGVGAGIGGALGIGGIAGVG